MVTVYVWLPSKHTKTGHASMKIAGNLPDELVKEIRKEFPNFSSYDESYISWYPSGNLWTMDGKAVTYQYDCLNTGPDFIQNLSGLDEAKMRTFWYRFKHKSPKSNWTLFKNCATVVAHTLRAGGGPFYFSFHMTWTPRQVKDYALVIAGASAATRRAAVHTAPGG